MTTTLVLSLVIGVVLALWCIRRPRADRTVYGVCSFVSEIPSYLVGISCCFWWRLGSNGSPCPVR